MGPRRASAVTSCSPAPALTISVTCPARPSTYFTRGSVSSRTRTRTTTPPRERNDLEMLRWAACGVAMGNAPDEVKAAADEVTGHVDDGALADVLSSLR